MSCLKLVLMVVIIWFCRLRIVFWIEGSLRVRWLVFGFLYILVNTWFVIEVRFGVFMGSSSVGVGGVIFLRLIWCLMYCFFVLIWWVSIVVIFLKVRFISSWVSSWFCFFVRVSLLLRLIRWLFGSRWCVLSWMRVEVMSRNLLVMVRLRLCIMLR